MEPPRETVETVDVYWGDRLEEKQFALQGELDEPCDESEMVSREVGDGYEPSVFWDENEHADENPKESKKWCA